MQKNGFFLMPWGRFGSLRDDITAQMKPKGQGGKELSKKFWAYCESAIESFK